MKFSFRFCQSNITKLIIISNDDLDPGISGLSAGIIFDRSKLTVVLPWPPLLL